MLRFIKKILKTYVCWGQRVWSLVHFKKGEDPSDSGGTEPIRQFAPKVRTKRNRVPRALPVGIYLIVKKTKVGFKNLMVRTKKVFGKKPVKLLFGFLKYAVVLFLGIVVLLSLAPLFSISGFQSLVVMSGSMEPEIRTGSVVVVRPSETLVVGDVITFARPDDPKNFITHRIESIKDDIIKTKGDANSAPDNWEVYRGDVQGKVAVSVPYLGYAVHFAKTQRGFVLLILLPALLIILDEIWAIKKEIERKYEAKLAAALKVGSQKKGRKKAARSGAVTVVMLALGLLALGVSSGQTAALLSDTEESVGNTITVGVWDDEDSPDGEAGVGAGDVVINEVYYDAGAGGVDAKREWIELYNSTDADIPLKDWTITDNVGARSISAEVSIPAHGFAIIAHDNSTWVNWESGHGPLPAGAVKINLGGSWPWLNDNGDKLTLKDPSDNEIDWVAWENYVAGWGITANRGESIARVTKGVDTDSVVDWEVLGDDAGETPNPGTNPHSFSAPEEPDSEELADPPETEVGGVSEDKSPALGSFLEPGSKESPTFPEDASNATDAEDDVGNAGSEEESPNSPEPAEDKSPTLGISPESDSGESAGPSPEGASGASGSEESPAESDEALGDDPPEAEDPESPADEPSPDPEDAPPGDEPESEAEAEDPSGANEDVGDDMAEDEPPADPSESEAGEPND